MDEHSSLRSNGNEESSTPCPLCVIAERGKLNPMGCDFDEHATIVLKKNGDMHIHAPFHNPALVRDMINMFIVEASKNSIPFTPSV